MGLPVRMQALVGASLLCWMALAFAEVPPAPLRGSSGAAFCTTRLGAPRTSSVSLRRVESVLKGFKGEAGLRLRGGQGDVAEDADAAEVPVEVSPVEVRATQHKFGSDTDS